MKKVILFAIFTSGIILASCSQIQKNINNTPLPNKPISCTDEAEGTPVITSISVSSGSIGTMIEVRGCNFSGFEGDIYAWIENEKKLKGILYSETGSTSKLLRTTLKSSVCRKDISYSGLECDSWLELIPGKYKIYVTPWGKESNKVDFIIK